MTKCKRVVITGADRGIGRELAIALTNRGHHVFVTGLDEKALRAVAKKCHTPNEWAVCDVRYCGQLSTVIGKAEHRMGRIDAVVANAGIARQMATDDPEFRDELERTLDVNLFGGINTATVARPYLAKTNGYMLFISSAAGLVNPPLMTPYNVSKAGIRAYAETFRFEVMPEDIKVGVATFTELDTDMTRIGFATEASEYLVTVRFKIGDKVLLQRRILPVAKLEPAIKALVRGVERKRRHVHSPRRVLWLRLLPAFHQRVLIETFVRPRVKKALELARQENGQCATILPPSN
ncbi:MAG TPA: SDR family NAD(P)-dependent oxidoreductase [Candidatus Bathyarchaeia archaeon]|nr:SDR family NAD(P)-dependent oxidoreductase [Candidatus Bathyarchaeia archaeon]